ncbi:uncharacterized protein LOC144568611 [Carex rostrata]
MDSSSSVPTKGDTGEAAPSSTACSGGSGSHNVCQQPLALPRGAAGPSKAKWTPEEDEILAGCVHQFQGKNWKNIAEFLPGRDKAQCLHRWQKVLNPELVKGSWSKEEDGIIVEMVHKYGPKKWSKIAQALPGRIGKQCRERWHNHLNPSIKKDAWTQEEEITLINAHAILGNKWVKLTKYLPGRCENSIKNHWNCSVKNRVNLYAARGLLEYPATLPLPSTENTLHPLVLEIPNNNNPSSSYLNPPQGSCGQGMLLSPSMAMASPPFVSWDHVISEDVLQEYSPLEYPTPLPCTEKENTLHPPVQEIPNSNNPSSSCLNPPQGSCGQGMLFSPSMAMASPPFVSWDYVDSGDVLKEEYSPLGIRQWIALSGLYSSDSSQVWSSPEELLRSAAKTKSLNSKQRRGMLFSPSPSPLQDKRGNQIHTKGTELEIVTTDLQDNIPDKENIPPDSDPGSGSKTSPINIPEGATETSGGVSGSKTSPINITDGATETSGGVSDSNGVSRTLKKRKRNPGSSSRGTNSTAIKELQLFVDAFLAEEPDFFREENVMIENWLDQRWFSPAKLIKKR